MTETKKPFNPLKTLWNIISTVSGAIGLISISDNWAEWQEKIQQIVEAYRDIVHWPFKWLWFEVADWVKDYLFLGLLVVSAFIKVSLDYEGNRRSALSSFRVLYFLLVFIFWPFIITGYILQALYFLVLSLSHLSENDRLDFENTKLFLTWFSASLILFLGVLLYDTLM